MAATEAVVLLGDGGSGGLQPLTGCSALLPVGSVPLIELTLAWLERNGMSEVSVYVCACCGRLRR